MRLTLTLSTSLLALASMAQAEGTLHIYNWGEYTNPALIEKFSQTYGVEVTLDTYTSNETMLAKVGPGASGYDIVVPSDYMVKIMIDQGLLAETKPNAMANFGNVRDEFVDVYWDSGRNFTVPWQYGTTSFVVDTATYSGDIDTLAILFNPPPELQGKINMLDDVNAVMNAASRYLGQERCSADREDQKRIYELLKTAKPQWKTFDYNGLTKMIEGDVAVSQIWNGPAYLTRQQVPTVRYAYPKEGFDGFMDNVAVLKDARNLENAKLFQNFVMDPQNASLISDFAGYDSGIKGSRDFAASKDWASAPEVNPPAGAPTPEFVKPCSEEVITVYNQIWTDIRK